MAASPTIFFENHMPAFWIALVSSALLIVLLRALAHKWNFLDHPGGRKQHSAPTPTIGGLAMFMGMLIALFSLDGIHGDLAVLIGCGALLVVLGVPDDRHGLSVSLRMTIQVILVLVVILGADGTVTHLGSLFGRDIPLGLFAIPFSMVAFVGGINAINMIDGADGMAGKMSLITLLGVASIFCITNNFQQLTLVMALIGALLGFLLFNSRLIVKRAWVFMGDSGSMWLGLVLGWFMAQMTHDKVAAEPAIVLWLFGIPLLDTLTVMIRRKRRKVSMFAPDRSHIHHVLEDTGLSIKRAVLLLSGVQVIMVGMGVLFFATKAPGALVFWGFVALFAAYYYRLRDCQG